MYRSIAFGFLCSTVFAASIAQAGDGTFMLLRKDNVGARRGGAVRYVPSDKAFLLWGFMDADPEFAQENPSMPLPEHDVVYFDLDKKQWRDHSSKEWIKQQADRKPLYFVPRCYHALTSGSERSLFRAPDGFPPSCARPDLNISFDQVVYHPPSKSLVYFTGGLTVAYDVGARRWRDLAPKQSPPPVLGGSLAYDPLHDEIILCGGGHVAEKRSDGRIVGYTDTWIYSFAQKNWRRHETKSQPPPRMYCRMVTDTKNQALVLFGGDGQSHYLADTWIFDLQTRQWREAKVAGPPPRAGHFTVFDPRTGWVFVGGGFNNADLRDLWAFDVAKETWQQLKAEVPTAAYLNADFDAERRLLLLVANDRAPGFNRSCDVLYSARSTYVCRLAEKPEVVAEKVTMQAPLPKRPPRQSGGDFKADFARIKIQEEKLRALPANQWVHRAEPMRVAPVRTWGSATFDTDRGRILLWGGGHCGYGGSDVDSYHVANHRWVSSEEHPEYPHRLWARGVRLAGVTFAGNPWTEHGRRIYAYDPPSKKMIAVRSILLTTGYEPDALRDFPGEPRARVDAKVKPPTAYSKYVTWTFDPNNDRWDIVGPAPLHVDTLVSTRDGVLGVNVDWPARLKDSGYMLPWNPKDPPVDNAVFRFDAAAKKWQRLGEPQTSPQNLYEMTSLAHDSKRDRLLLHGGGARRDELWAFDLKTKRWQNLEPRLAADSGAEPPQCQREMIYLPKQDEALTYGPAPGREPGAALWAYRCATNTWQRIAMAAPPGVAPSVARGQNRAMVYDPVRELVFLILGAGDQAQTQVYALRFQEDAVAPLKEAWDYTGPMKKIAAKFRGNEGVVLHVGGSMTIANPYGTWARSGKGKTPDDLAILNWMHTDTKDKRDGWWLCRTEIVHYRAYTAESGLKSAMLLDGGKRGLPTLAKMLDDYKPRMVTIECGIYDVEDGVARDVYRKNMAKALDLVLERGAIPVLNTIPPFKAQFERTKQFNETLRDLAKERGIPILDLEREILTRRPADWYGSLMDRIHLTASQTGGNPAAEPTPENLKKSGYQLRGFLTVRKVAEIKSRVLD